MSFRYLLFNKPFNVLSQFTTGTTPAISSPKRKTLADFIAVRDVYPVGRLDFDSEGLMLLTDDGLLQHRIMGPRFAHPRTYWVQVEGLITQAAVASLRGGVMIRGGPTQKCEASLIETPTLWPREPPIRVRQHIPTSWLELTLTEGRNRQVRRMTAAVGFPTLRIVRIAIGDLTVENLAPGAWRELAADEIAALTKAKGGRLRTALKSRTSYRG